MSSIDNEKKMLQEIAKNDFSENVKKDFFRENGKSLESYYLDKSGDNIERLVEYGFQKPIELIKILEDNWDDVSEKKMIPAIAVAAFKLQNGVVKTDRISEKIYNF